MSNGNRWSKFWWADWQSDTGLRMTSLAARGLWMELLCMANAGQPYGHVTLTDGRSPTAKEISWIVGTSEKEVTKALGELERAGVFSRTANGTIYSRRMLRDAQQVVDARVAGLQGGNPKIIRGTVPKEERARRFRRSDSPEKTLRIFHRDGGCCHWCDTPLQTDHPGPDFFHVDHIVAVRDGGGIEEGNLVAACAECNHRRARHDPPAPSDPNGKDKVGRNGKATSDHMVGSIRPQALEAEAESEEEREEGSKGERSDSLPSARAVAPAPRRPEDWQPSILVIAYAVSLGLSEPEVFQSAEGMRNWHIAHGKRLADYDARFRLWVWDDAKKARRPVRDQNPITTMMQKWGTGSIVMGHYDDDFDQQSNRTQVLL